MACEPLCGKEPFVVVLTILCLLYVDKELSFQHNFATQKQIDCLQLTDCNTKCSISSKNIPQVNLIYMHLLSFIPLPPYKHIHTLPHMAINTAPFACLLQDFASWKVRLLQDSLIYLYLS